MSRWLASVLVLASLLGAALAACASSDYHAPDAATDAAATDGPVDASIDATDACAPSKETCNGRDDDCDPEVDEDFPTLGDVCSVGQGVCVRMGHLRCTTDGAGVECDATAGPSGNEICNGDDDDCDGATDEGFQVGTMCDGVDTDVCTEGAFQCAGGGAICSDTTGNNVETCNGLNDDCDNMTDEGFNLGMMCDGVDTDACAEGMIVCGAGGMTTCSDATGSMVETCNGLDDDCMNGVDNGFLVGQACNVGVGACQRTGMNMCNATGTGVTCNATPGMATPETCGDGIDQDCTGADVTCPINDLPTSPIDITNGGTFTVDLTAARNDQESMGASCGIAGGRDVFYRFTLPAAEVVYVDTFGSSFDSVVRIYPGACTALPAMPTCFDDQCGGRQTQGALQLAAGNYCLAVDQYSNTQTTGSLVLTFTRGGRTGTAIAAVNGTQTSTSCTGTNGSTGTCQVMSTAHDLGYHFLVCPGTAKAVSANTCTGTAFDSVVYLRKAGAAGDLACNDDNITCGATGLQSTFPSTNAVGPGLFWLIVDGYQAQCGNFSLSYLIN